MNKLILKAVALKVAMALVALGLCAATLPAKAGAADIKLSYANFPPASTFPCVQMERWVQEVQKRTNGQVEVATYPGGTLLNAKAMFRGVMQGTADIGCLSMAYQPGVFPLSRVTEMPVGFTSATVASKVLWDIFVKYQPEEFADVKVLTMFTSAPSNLMNKKPVKSLADLKGLEVRASGTSGKVMELLGAIPVAMPMPQVPEALQKGVVESVLSSLEVLKDMNFAELCRHETIINSSIYPFAVVMNKAKYDALPEDVKKVFDELGPEQAEWTGRYMDEHVKESLAWAKEKYNIEIDALTPAEMETAAAKTEPLINEWKKQASEAGVDADAVFKDMMALKAKYEAAEAK